MNNVDIPFGTGRLVSGEKRNEVFDLQPNDHLYIATFGLSLPETINSNIN
ncbi:hypothetical protein [Alicyclobacillus dauci]|uniref:Uncharacterized protein n=1 Tax=Alicyclobacillus dauci TaxID=1475485 RepID=A0ABY6ZA39_9BACL|nr:hypothetical protein [Alicyclobacillus dauci]WAH39026.1 hypothetical protein NZD86_11350 [Alicyclobacillus dauci]